MMQNLSQERSLNPIRTRPLSGARFAQRRLGELEFSIGSRIQAIRDGLQPERPEVTRRIWSRQASVGQGRPAGVSRQI